MNGIGKVANILDCDHFMISDTFHKLLSFYKFRCCLSCIRQIKNLTGDSGFRIVDRWSLINLRMNWSGESSEWSEMQIRFFFFYFGLALIRVMSCMKRKIDAHFMKLNKNQSKLTGHWPRTKPNKKRTERTHEKQKTIGWTEDGIDRNKRTQNKNSLKANQIATNRRPVS